MADVKILFQNSLSWVRNALFLSGLAAFLTCAYAEPLSAQERNPTPDAWNVQVRAPWQMRCRLVSVGGQRRQACTAKFSRIDSRTRRVLAVVTLRSIEGRKDVSLRVRLPGGGLVQNRGVQVRIDNDANVIRLPITNCGRSGCIANTRLTGAQLARFHTGRTLQLLAVGQRGEPVVVAVPLIGFPRNFGVPRPAVVGLPQGRAQTPSKESAPALEAPPPRAAKRYYRQGAPAERQAAPSAGTRMGAAPPPSVKMESAPPPTSMRKSAAPPQQLTARAPPPAPSASAERAAAPPPAANGAASRESARRRAFRGPREVPPDQPYAVVKVYYATDRQKTGSGEPAERYGVDRGSVSYGYCTVSIPRDHRLGELEAPSLWRLEFSENPEEHVVLLSVSEQQKSAFFDDVRNAINNSSGQSAFVFVHGYNVSFKDAARRTAQMSYDLGFDGAPVFYSWPSQAQVASYVVDETNVAWSQTNLKEFLRDFAEQSDAKNIFLIGHSMGTRALTGALKDLFVEYPEVRPRLKEIILAAPDIDADIFKRDIAPRIRTPNRSITLYASSNDTALIASRRFHGYQRAGDTSGGVTIVEGVDTIDSTDVETGFIGHAYYAEAKSIVTDIFNLIRYGKRPSERQGLAPVASAGGQYWRFLAANDRRR